MKSSLVEHLEKMSHTWGVCSHTAIFVPAVTRGVAICLPDCCPRPLRWSYILWNICLRREATVGRPWGNQWRKMWVYPWRWTRWRNRGHYSKLYQLWHHQVLWCHNTGQWRLAQWLGKERGICTRRRTRHIHL